MHRTPLHRTPLLRAALHRAALHRAAPHRSHRTAGGAVVVRCAFRTRQCG
ncbi:hypothetical protein [Pseudarthrobacter equi]|nr:hypothetical protein [Pseudarthrobacter equi]